MWVNCDIVCTCTCVGNAYKYMYNVCTTRPPVKNILMSHVDILTAYVCTKLTHVLHNISNDSFVTLKVCSDELEILKVDRHSYRYMYEI